MLRSQVIPSIILLNRQFSISQVLVRPWFERKHLYTLIMYSTHLILEKPCIHSLKFSADHYTCVSHSDQFNLLISPCSSFFARNNLESTRRKMHTLFSFH